MKATPLPYQTRSVEAIDRFRGRCLLAHDMGLGKTLISLWWWDKTPEAKPGLVVCPASAKWVWEREALHNLGVRAVVLEGTQPRSLESMGARPQLVVVNYDVLHRWLPELKRFGFRSLFVDECHYAKNTRAKRTKAVRSVAKGIRHVIAISGTPVLSKPIELFPTLNMLRPSIFPSKWAFAHEYCNPRWTPWGWKYDGAANLPELHGLLKHVVMIRDLKKDVLPELPDKIRRVVPLPLSDEDEYTHARDSFLSWMGKHRPAKLLSAKRAETLVKLGYLKRLSARLKLRALVDRLNEWFESYPEEKMIVFAVHRKMIEALKRRLVVESVVVDGSVTGRRRIEAVDQFQRSPKIRCLIGNIQAAGVVFTMTAASAVSFAEMDWVPANHVQAEDRAHRIGQEKKLWIWWYVAAGTIEEHLCEILEEKQRIVDGVLDGGTDEFNELDVHRQLLAKLTGEEE